MCLNRATGARRCTAAVAPADCPVPASQHSAVMVSGASTALTNSMACPAAAPAPLPRLMALLLAVPPPLPLPLASPRACSTTRRCPRATASPSLQQGMAERIVNVTRYLIHRINHNRRPPQLMLARKLSKARQALTRPAARWRARAAAARPPQTRSAHPPAPNQGWHRAAAAAWAGKRGWWTAP